MKESILRALQSRPNDFFSGESLSDSLGCTRSAVWKAIQELRQEGYQIEAKSRRGYQLVAAPDQVTEYAVLPLLRTRSFGRSFFYHASVDSTQTEAHRLARENAAEGSVVMADEQLGGRGRMGRPWHSLRGRGIWMSLILRPKVPLTQAHFLTLTASVAVAQALRHHLKESGQEDLSREIRIKWPNDILLRGRKICGILTELHAEMDRIHYIILGIGLNVNQQSKDFPPDLQEKVTSLSQTSGQVFSRARLVSQLLSCLEENYEEWLLQGFGDIRRCWLEMAYRLGETITVSSPQGLVNGTFCGIDEQGALQLKANGERKTIYSAEVHI